MTRFFIKYNATTKQYDGYAYDGNELLSDHRYSGLLMVVTIKVIIFSFLSIISTFFVYLHIKLSLSRLSL